ncbi:related to allantoate permease [Rhynchosporium agropyri]|uniref:Related to allantoate permease n=1 Tax=Rhynchosporium agropyri TaxID=914238 RepID=A0A1E1KHE0_9HELO|nr:related to allantoate permease [Rhynchosporium agropyri]
MDSKFTDEYAQQIEDKREDEMDATIDYVPGSDEEKKLVRKIDTFLLPTIFLMYLFSYMDRTNIGNARIAGMAKDLDLDSQQYSFILVVFFIGYVLCEVPSNMILSRAKPSIFLPAIMFLWGCVTIGMAWADSYEHLIAFRVVIGCLEAGFGPGILLMLSSQSLTLVAYKKDEQSKRFSVYISAAILAGAFGGLLAGAIASGMDGALGIRGWRWLFIIEGALTAGWSVCAYFLLLDFPANTKRLSPRERELAIQRIIADSNTVATEDSPPISHLQALKLGVQNWRTWGFTVGYMVIIGAGTLSYFYPTLVQGLGYTSTKAQYMTIPIYMVAFVCNIVTGYFADKAPGQRGLIIGGGLIIATICSVIFCVVYNFTARYVLLVFMAGAIWTCNALSLSYASSTFGAMPNETRAICLAIVNALGNLASIYGAYLYPSTDAPKYIMGFSVVSAMSAFGAVVYILLHVFVRRYPVSRKV